MKIFKPYDFFAQDLLEILDNLPVGVVLYQEKIVYANPISLILLSCSPRDVFNRYTWELFPKPYQEFIRNNVERRIKGNLVSPKVYPLEVTTSRKEKKWIRIEATTVKYRDEHLGLATIIDITKERKLEERLTELANIDDLTKIYNRRKFFKELSKEIDRAKRYNRPLSLIMADIDDFKLVNDTYGHLIGDCVLKDLAQLFKDMIRASDCVARYGGEEFVIITPETDLAGAVKLGEKLRQVVEGFSFCSGIHITISLGVTQFEKEDTTDLLIRKVDNAMYEAKRQGKNQVVAYGV